jgi:hypothetical protein
MKYFKSTVLFLTAILILFVYNVGIAENQPGERSLKSIHDEFLGYAQEYYDEAKKYGRKAERSQGRERSQLQEIAQLSQRMGDVKVRMAKGFLNDDMSSVKKAEQEYYNLNDQREIIFKKLRGK